MILERLKSIFNSSIAKNLGILVSGTVLAQLIVIGFQVVLRRIYAPEDFGAFAVYMSVVGIAVTISSLRYEQTIMLPKDNYDGFILTKLSIFVSFVLVMIFAALLYTFSDLFINLTGFPQSHKTWLIFLPLSIFFFACYQALNYYLLRLDKFSVSGSNKPIRRIIEGFLQILFGYFGKGFGLVVGDIVGHASIIFRTLFIIKNQKWALVKRQDSGIWDIAKRYGDFPIKNTLPALLNALSRLLPIIIISRKFDAEITGYFDLARVVLIIPLSLVSVSLNQILVKHFSQKRNKNQSIKSETLGVFGALLGISVLFLVVVKLFSYQGFTFVFGDAWSTSGSFAEILIWAFAIKFLISPFNSSFIAFEKIGIGSIWQVFYFVLVTSLFFINNLNINEFLSYYVWIEVLAFLVAGIINFSILHQYEKSLNAK